jgi:hypothetical protein
LSNLSQTVFLTLYYNLFLPNNVWLNNQCSYYSQMGGGRGMPGIGMPINQQNMMYNAPGAATMMMP